jgi:hypothetical protein
VDDPLAATRARLSAHTPLTLEERLAATCKQKLAAAQTALEREDRWCLEEFEEACKRGEGVAHGMEVLSVEGTQPLAAAAAAAVECG